MSGDPWVEAIEAAAAAHTETLFARAVEEWAASVPYTRPGSHLLLTGEEWRMYDEWEALATGMDARYNAVRARAGLPVMTAAMERRIW